MALSLFIDFDGTLVVPNVAILLVEEFGRNGKAIAREVDEELHAGRITLREAWEREAAVLPADRIPEMADFVVRHAPLRSGARELIELVERVRLPTTVVSGGLDFYIRPVLEREGIGWPVRSESLELPPDGGVRVVHPFGHPTCRLCGICKAELVRPRPPDRSVFIGDGSTDRYAAEVADVVFARHRLLAYCRRHAIPCEPFDDLEPVVERLRELLNATGPARASGTTGRADSDCPISRELSMGRPAPRSTGRSV